MKIILLTIGKTKNTALQQLEIDYEGRIKHYCQFEHINLSDVKRSKHTSPEELKKIEAEAFFKIISASDLVFLLDEKGKSYTSRGFSEFLQKQMNSGQKRLIFIVGGAFGFSEEMYSKCNGKISLSAMTFSHEMIRTFILEQIYRGFSILKGEPYHND